MNKIIPILIVLALISTASAAVYISANPEARIYFTREGVSEETVQVETFIRWQGVWTTNGTLGGDTGLWEEDILPRDMYHQNEGPNAFNGIVYIEIECAEGLVNGISGIMDFESITFTDPYGDSYSCNNNETIERLSDCKIIITPTTNVYTFEPGETVPTHLSIDFLPMAYGYYTITAYVDEV